MTLTLGKFLQVVDREKKLEIKRALEQVVPWDAKVYVASLRHAAANPGATVAQCIAAGRASEFKTGVSK